MQTLQSWLEHISLQHWQTIEMGLERMQVMLERLKLDFTQQCVITVAGTNGKGSTCVATEQILLAAGLRGGTTLSPHVVCFNERIRINAVNLTDDQICDAFAAIEVERGSLPLTYFEYAALAALWSFSQTPIDVIILEIGLGGRLDAFNAVDANVAVVTSIGLDHQEFLGTTHEEIGIEKAGIFRRGQQVVLGSGMPNSVISACQKLALQPLISGQDFAVKHNKVEPHENGPIWHLRYAHEQLANLPLGSIGAENIAVAYVAAGLCSVHVNENSLRKALAHLCLPGRMQWFIYAGRRLLADVSHNPQAVEFLFRHLAHHSIEPKAIICGMLKGKDPHGVYQCTREYSKAPWFLIDTLGDRAQLGAELAGQMGLDNVETGRLEQIMPMILSATQPGDVILVLGAFNVVEQCHLSFERGAKHA